MDLFFNKEFYGNTYTPDTVIKDQTIGQLTDLIWNNYSNIGRKLTLTFDAIKRSKEYNCGKKKFGNWMDLINEAIKDTICDVKEFESTDYIVKNDQIGYKEGDRISFKATLEYKTLFTYKRTNYNEHLKEQIKKRMNDHAGGTRKQLAEFNNSKAFNPFQGNVLVLTGEASKDEKNSIVNSAPVSKKILLLTKAFGRGTDFQVHDKIVKYNGGPHVIHSTVFFVFVLMNSLILLHALLLLFLPCHHQRIKEIHVFFINKFIQSTIVRLFFDII